MKKTRCLIRLLILLLICSSCAYRSPHYYQAYAHICKPISAPPLSKSDYYLIFLVDAPRLDYRDSRCFLKSIAKHPANGSKNGDVGHAWLYLHGIAEEKEWVIEGGHSGELGEVQPRYWEGVLNYALYGYVIPPPSQRSFRFEPNPVKYLWEPQNDGFFQLGSGNHTPTFAAKINLTAEQFQRVKNYIDPFYYPYQQYSLTGKQCSSFIAEIATLIDFPLEHQVTLSIQPQVALGKQTLQLWSDEYYSKITFSSPDRIEQSLVEAVREGRAENALYWYLKRYGKSKPQKIAETYESLRLLPSRLERIHLLR